MKKQDLPAMPFYTGDWFKCPEVRALPLDYRALWFDMICFMWESTERGVMVKSNGEPYSQEEIIRMVGLDQQNSGIWLSKLLSNNVASIREDGAIYCRRMVKDEQIRQIRSRSGQKGGFATAKHAAKQLAKGQQFAEYENEYETEDETKEEAKKKHNKQIKPTLENIQNYCKETNSPIDPEYFFHFYEQTNWVKANGRKVINWKSTIKTWEKRNDITAKSNSKLPADVTNKFL